MSKYFEALKQELMQLNRKKRNAKITHEEYRRMLELQRLTRSKAGKKAGK